MLGLVAIYAYCWLILYGPPALRRWLEGRERARKALEPKRGPMRPARPK